MSTPRRTPGNRTPGARPAAGRRPARPGARASARPAGRVSSRTASALRPPVAVRSTRRTGITGRAAVLVLVIGALIVSAALPVREFLNQRDQIGQARSDQAAIRQRVADLEAEKARLGDPAYVASEARRRLQYVLPGETAYVVLAPPGPPAAAAAARDKAAAPWYTQLWGSVRAADAPPAR
ncbi:MAG: septum formation initiator family protein [Frankiales bacterium]|nr:septum formation initiator family protein [Frankiales bacterium]